MSQQTDAGTELVVATWNLEWAPPKSVRGQLVRDLLGAANADVICVTEGFAGNLPEGGQIIEAEADYGYPLRDGRRKVLLWTRHAWVDVDSVGSPDFPTGRFVAGTLQLAAAEVRVIGVCIPWAAAHVSSGRRNRARWEDHLRYLRALGPYLRTCGGKPTIILGDFNQAIPRSRQRLDVADTLEAQVLKQGFCALTAGMRSDDGLPFIDHIVLSNDLAGEVVGQLPKQSNDLRLSDHAGVSARCAYVGVPA